MLRYLFLSLCFVSFLRPFEGVAEHPLLHNTYHRNTTSLNGEWHYIVDPYENGFYNYRYEPYELQKYPGKGAFFRNAKPSDKTDLVEYDFDQSPTLTVPGDWNTQEDKLFYYEGSLWYKKSFDYTKKASANRVFLYFGAVNYRADVYLNGKKLGSHIGGFTPFDFEITDVLQPKGNFIVVKVDNKREKSAVPTLNTDWWNYGGITRDVKLVETPACYIEDYQLQLNPDDPGKVEGYIRMGGTGYQGVDVKVEIPELGLEIPYTTDEKGLAKVAFSARKIKKWSPAKPKLYQVSLSGGGGTISDDIGFRTIETKGKDILLNGERVFLKGICLHEERPEGKGRGLSKQDALQLLTWAKELGCNYLRLAHYPHNEHIIRLADEMGLLIWEEIPVYWTIDWENPATYANAEGQLSEMVARDKNRAAVIIWSMANETPVTEARNHFLSELAKRARELDPTRLISAALEQSDFQGDPFTRTISDPFAENVDVLSFNQYIGWDDGLPDKCGKINWEILQDKPVVISEFGAGAKYGHRGDSLTRWTEDYQAHLYRETIEMLKRIDNLSGFSPWILVDFRSPRRPLPGIQDGWNRKGLISEKGEFKQAFKVLQKYYQQLD